MTSCREETEPDHRAQAQKVAREKAVVILMAEIFKARARAAATAVARAGEEPKGEARGRAAGPAKAGETDNMKL